MKNLEDYAALHALGASALPLIGEGGEARVYALNERQVLRLLRPGASLSQEIARAELLAEIATGRQHLAFATPEVERVVEIEGRIAVIERRMPGVPLARALAVTTGQERRSLLRAYLNAAGQIGDIDVKRDFFGDVGGACPVRRPKYREFLQARVERSRSLAGPLSDLPMTDIEKLPDCPGGALVHFDIFPGNVMVDSDGVTAVIDFGTTSMIGDRRMDCWSAVAYLDAELSPEANQDDRDFALGWLAQRGISADFEAARRWIASYWRFAHDDPKVSAWCSRILTS